MSKEDELKPLNKREQVFVNEYLKNFNATEAYLKIHPNSKRESAWVSASRMLSSDKVKAHVEQRLKEIHMSADEALKLRADIARGDITEFLDSQGLIDIDKMRENGKGRLVKKIKQRTITKIGKTNKDEDTEIHDVEIELYPADSAQQDILKVHEKIKDNPITVNMNWKDFIENANAKSSDK